MDLLNFFYRFYCVFAFPIWIAAISLPNSTSETNSSVMNKTISDNDGVIDGKTGVFLNTGNNSTESNLFSNLDSSSATTTTNYTDVTNDLILNKNVSTKTNITQTAIHQEKNISLNANQTYENSTSIVSNTESPETTTRLLSTTEGNLAARDVKPNNTYTVSSISFNKNISSNNNSEEYNITTSVPENEIQDSSIKTTISKTSVVVTKGEASETSIAIQTTAHYNNEQSTKFAQNVKIGHVHKKHKKTMHHLNLVPIEDGPFGSLIWKDKKYLISVLVPIGIGIIGAGCIIGMAYVVRFCQKTEQQVQRMRQALSQPKEERNDQIVLLVNSSDDDF